MELKLNVEGGALYFAPSSDSTEPIRFLSGIDLGEIVLDIDEEKANERDLEEFKHLKRDLSDTFVIDISSSRAWRRVRRIMRKARQKAKREWQKRKKTGRPLYDPEDC